MEKVKLPTRIKVVAILLIVIGCLLNILLVPMCAYSSSDYPSLVLEFSYVFFGILLLRRIKWAWCGAVLSIIGTLLNTIITFIEPLVLDGHFYIVSILFILPQLVFLTVLLLDRKKYLEVASLEISPKRKKINILIIISLLAIFGTYFMSVVSGGCGREKAIQAAIKANLKTVQMQSETYYDDNKQFHIENSTSCDVGMFTDSTIKDALTVATKFGNGTTCSITEGGQAWAVRVSFWDSSNGWCIDSMGNARGTTINPATGLCSE